MTVRCLPDWTKPEPRAHSSIPTEELDERVEILGVEEDGLLQVRDRKTGRVSFMPPGSLGR